MVKKFMLRFSHWTQFSDPNFIGNILSTIVRSQSNICLLSTGLDQGADLGHDHVIELLHSLFNLVLVALTPTVKTSVLSSIFLMADLVVRGNLMMA